MWDGIEGDGSILNFHETLICQIFKEMCLENSNLRSFNADQVSNVFIKNSKIEF